MILFIFAERLKTPEPINKPTATTPTRRSPMQSSTSLKPGAVNSNIHSPSTQTNESVTVNQSLPRKPSVSPQRGGVSATAQSQTSTIKGAVGGQAQPASNSSRKITPQINSPAAVSSQPTQQFQAEPIGPQPTQEPTQKQAQQLVAFLNKIPKQSTSTAPEMPLVSPTQNGQHKSGLEYSSVNVNGSLQSRQNNYSNRPMPSQGGSCDIPDNNSFSRMPISTERLNSAPAYNVTTNQPSLNTSSLGRGNPPRGRSPAQQQPHLDLFGGNRNSALKDSRGNTVGGGASGGAEATGGYNFNRIMDDHFEHYKRPASRERSVDKINMPTALSEAPSRASNRPASRARTPSVSSGAVGMKISSSRTDIDLDARVEALDDTKANGGLPSLQGGAELTYRGTSQEIAHLGTVPKRTESMYFKPLLDEEPNQKVCITKCSREIYF